MLKIKPKGSSIVNIQPRILLKQSTKPNFINNLAQYIIIPVAQKIAPVIKGIINRVSKFILFTI